MKSFRSPLVWVRFSISALGSIATNLAPDERRRPLGNWSIIWLTTCLLEVEKLKWRLGLKGWHKGEQLFHCFNHASQYNIQHTLNVAQIDIYIRLMRNQWKSFAKMTKDGNFYLFWFSTLVNISQFVSYVICCFDQSWCITFFLREPKACSKPMI